MRSGKADGRFVSPDVWVMARPGPAFAALAGRASPGSAWSAFRRPLLVAVVLGCVTSLITFPGITLRLAGPATLSWSFVPLAEVLGLAVACAGEGRRLPFGRKVDLFFMGYLPWLLWLTGIAITFSFLSTARAFALLDSVWLDWAGPIVIAWSAWIDFCFFRSAAGHSRGGALGRLVLQRAISWSLIILIFSGGALLPGIRGLRR
jgi:hypothetical protein